MDSCSSEPIQRRSPGDNTECIRVIKIVGPTGLSGKDGIEGTNGIDGIDGIDGIEGTNGIDGIDGIDGIEGTNGIDGIDGTNGIDGGNGTDGTNGIDGGNGTDGTNGTNGIDGSNGTDGTDGTNGIDGANGIDGSNGTDGIDGEDGKDCTNGIVVSKNWQRDIVNGGVTNVKWSGHSMLENNNETYHLYNSPVQLRTVTLLLRIENGTTNAQLTIDEVSPSDFNKTNVGSEMALSNLIVNGNVNTIVSILNGYAIFNNSFINTEVITVTFELTPSLNHSIWKYRTLNDHSNNLIIYNLTVE